MLQTPSKTSTVTFESSTVGSNVIKSVVEVVLTSLRISFLELYQTYLIGSPCVTEAAKVTGSGVDLHNKHLQKV